MSAELTQAQIVDHLRDKLVGRHGNLEILGEYISCMLQTQKPKEQVQQELEAFLKEDTEAVVNWLFQPRGDGDKNRVKVKTEKDKDRDRKERKERKEKPSSNLIQKAVKDAHTTKDREGKERRKRREDGDRERTRTRVTLTEVDERAESPQAKRARTDKAAAVLTPNETFLKDFYSKQGDDDARGVYQGEYKAADQMQAQPRGTLPVRDSYRRVFSEDNVLDFDLVQRKVHECNVKAGYAGEMALLSIFRDGLQIVGYHVGLFTDPKCQAVLCDIAESQFPRALHARYAKGFFILVEDRRTEKSPVTIDPVGDYAAAPFAAKGKGKGFDPTKGKGKGKGVPAAKGIKGPAAKGWGKPSGKTGYTHLSWTAPGFKGSVVSPATPQTPAAAMPEVKALDGVVEVKEQQGGAMPTTPAIAPVVQVKEENTDPPAEPKDA